jgi:hypothetical protein
LLQAAPGSADPGVPSSATAWQALTRNDVEAAYTLLIENHPAALPEVHDAAFTSALRAAHAKALARAATVSSFEGYRATLAELAGSLGDGHLYTWTRVVPREVRWAGVVAAKRDASWVVAAGDPKLTGQDLVGARIVSCDKVPIETFAREVMPFHALPGVEASVVLHGSELLVDDGNPFVHPPHECSFERSGKPVTVQLHWQPIASTKLRETYAKPPIGRAGFGVRPLDDGGYWIALEALTQPAQAVIDAARAASAAIRAARYVVIDLRGNGGGNDLYGRTLANALYGDAHAASVLGPMPTDGGCKSAWRASPDNLAAMEAWLAERTQAGEAAVFAGLAAAIDDMKAARAQGRALTGALSCPQPAARSQAAAPSLIRAPVVVVTDAACFSSCLSTLQFFRKLGAIQVGQSTNADTHNSEVREVALPSGLSMFTTLQAIMPDEPYRIGPFTPAHVYAGDIADSDAVARWIADTVIPAHHVAPRPRQ